MDGAPYKSAKVGGGRSFECFAFDHESVPMSCLQQLDALGANYWTKNNVQRNHQQLQSPDGTQHSEQHHITMSMVTVTRGVHHINYVRLHKDTLSVKYYMEFLTSDMHST